MDGVTICVRATCPCQKQLAKDRYIPPGQVTPQTVFETKRAAIQEVTDKWLYDCRDHASPISILLTVRTSGTVSK